MSGKRVSKDLIVLVADLDIEQAVRGLLSRPHHIRIKSLRDPTVAPEQTGEGPSQGNPDFFGVG